MAIPQSILFGLIQEILCIFAICMHEYVYKCCVCACMPVGL